MEAAYGNTILESSYDETVMEVDFVKLKVEKSEKKQLLFGSYNFTSISKSNKQFPKSCHT